MRPLLLLYSSGLGGEFITKTLSENSDEFNNVDYHLFEKNNMTSARCCTYYAALWENPDDPTKVYYKYNNLYFEKDRVDKDWSRLPEIFGESLPPEIEEFQTKGKKK